MVHRFLQSRLFPALLAVLALSGCNSSSDSGGVSGTNNIGNIGNNGSTASGELKAVTSARKVMGRAYLDGRASYHRIASYHWQQTAGTSVTLTEPSSSLIEFDLPTVASAELLTFKLTVTHANGTSDSQLLSLEVTPDDEPKPLSSLYGPTVVGEELLFPKVNIFAAAQEVVKVGDYLYIASSQNGVQYVNVSNPLAPEVTGSIGAINRATDLSLNDSGDVLYIADNDGLRVVNVSSPAQPVVLTSLVRHSISAIQASGNLLYTIGYDEYIVYDISEPGKPTIKSRLELPFINIGAAKEMMVIDDLAYVLTTYGGLRILDISDPDQLDMIGSYSIDQISNDFWLAGQNAYIATSRHGVIVVDVSDPTLPSYVGSMTDDNTINDRQEALTIEVFDNIAYVGTKWSVQTWDVTNPAQATFLGEVASGGQALKANGQFVYAASQGFVYVIDISRPESVPEIEQRLDLNALAESTTGGFIEFNSTMNVINASDPGSLTSAETVLDTQYASLSYVENDTLYVFGVDLKVFDVSDINSPNLKATYSLNGVELPHGLVDVDDDRFFFINDRDQQVTILDFRDANNITVTKPDFSGNGYQLLAVDGDIAFVSESEGQYLSAINFSNPANLTRLASIDVTDRDGVSLGGVAVREGDHLIISGRLLSPGDGLAIIDVSDPAAPKLTAYAREMSNFSDNIIVLGNLVFLTEDQNESGYVMVYDISDRAHPAYTTLSPEGRSTYSVKAAGNTLLIKNNWAHFQTKTHVVDITSLNP